MSQEKITLVQTIPNTSISYGNIMANYKNKYPSRHKADAFVTVGEWIGEVMCERKAIREGKELPQSFWLVSKKDNPNFKVWYDYLVRQIQTAYKLIKKHGEEKVLFTLKQNRGIYSLMPKWVNEKIEKTVVPNKSQEASTAFTEKDVVTYREAQEKKSVLSLLEEL